MSDDQHLVLAEGSRFEHLENPRQRAFLTAFRELGNIRRAAEAAGIARRTHYKWRDTDAEYVQAFEAAKEDAADLLEAEAWRRAVDGVEKPVGWYKGEPGGKVREYSDTLLIFLLKAMRPHKFKDRLEIRGALANLDFSQLPDHLLARIAQGEHPLTVLASAVEEQGALPPELEVGGGGD